ncbi:alpha/beta fold hydrolase [Herbiconiux sp. CPCC 203407]|uniref:Alpha/beta fold hydrolase n=1 Tax=Herbiconiux oxytropis TaxID=2970915 RepID=A0AA41XGJ9_9MICO|nr:alpha/beta hydrolase [Herbiconiux oxytropis]MCS5722867.1 alpha/beta fold hydrolase [Herbiconiux oxytropis]MCS5727797.1 alpha/beta fold hydrolase [Herbiconiux oxytropis]
MAHHLTTLRSGDVMGLSAAGDPLSERLVLLCLPTPGGGMFDPDPTVTSRWGVHLVALDRPGYGATPAPDAPGPDALSPGDPSKVKAVPGTRATIQRRADDLAAYLSAAHDDAEQTQAAAYGTAGVVGWGTGGMVALSLAARHPQLVDRVAVFQTPAPRAAGSDDEAAPAPAPPFGLDLLGISPGDRLLERPGLRNRLQRMLDEAATQGGAGAELDHEALADTSWAEELGAIRADVILIYADDATGAGVDDGHWYRDRIPSSSVVRVSSGGALALVTQWSRILQHVAPDHGGLPEVAREGQPQERVDRRG